MAGVKALLARLWRSVTSAAAPAWRFGVTWVTRVTRTTSRLWARVQARHSHRMEVDPSYPIALVAGLTAGFGVLVGHPAIAAGVGLAAGQILGVRPVTERESYPSSRYGSTARSRWDQDRPGRALWEQDWDE